MNQGRHPPEDMKIATFQYFDEFLAQLVLIVVVYSAWFYYGFKKNRFLAKEWLAANVSIFQDQCFYLGVGLVAWDCLGSEMLANPFKSGLLKNDGARRVQFYATGRRKCRSILVNLHLKPRHDILLWMYSLAYSWDDDILVDVEMNDCDMESFVFLIVCNESGLGSEIFDCDVSSQIRHIPLESLPQNLKCSTDCGELVPQVLKPEIVRLLWDLKEYIKLIIFSDQMTQPNASPNKASTKLLRFRFKFTQDFKISRDLTRLVFLCVNVVNEAEVSYTTQCRLNLMRRRPTTMKSTKQ